MPPRPTLAYSVSNIPIVTDQYTKTFSSQDMYSELVNSHLYRARAGGAGSGLDVDWASDGLLAEISAGTASRYVEDLAKFRVPEPGTLQSLTHAHLESVWEKNGFRLEGSTAIGGTGCVGAKVNHASWFCHKPPKTTSTLLPEISETVDSVEGAADESTSKGKEKATD